MHGPGQIETVLERAHANIGEKQVESAGKAGMQKQRLAAVAGPQYPVTVAIENVGDQFPYRVFIIDDKHVSDFGFRVWRWAGRNEAGFSQARILRKFLKLTKPFFAKNPQFSRFSRKFRTVCA